MAPSSGKSSGGGSLYSASSGSGTIPGYSPGGGSLYSASSGSGTIPGYSPGGYGKQIAPGASSSSYAQSGSGASGGLKVPLPSAYGVKAAAPWLQSPVLPPSASEWAQPPPSAYSYGGGGGGGYVPGGEAIPPEEGGPPTVPPPEGGLLSKIPIWGWALGALGVYWIFFRKKKRKVG